MAGHRPEQTSLVVAFKQQHYTNNTGLREKYSDAEIKGQRGGEGANLDNNERCEEAGSIPRHQTERRLLWG